MKFDSVLSYLGEFGSYQKRIYFLLCLPAITCAMHKLAWVFLGARVDHRCVLPTDLPNATFQLPVDILNQSIPWDTSASRWSQCTMYAVDNGTIDREQIVGCDSWMYDRTTYKSSAVMDWDLVCERSVMHATAQAIFMVGVLLGSIIFGSLSDICGRRPVFFTALVLQVTFGLIAAFTPEFYSFSIVRLIVGASTSGVFLVAYVIGVELVGPSKRTIVGVLCQLFFSAGYMVTALFAYLFPDWQTLQMALSLPGLLFLCYWWFIPESIRWLLTKKRTEEARVLLRKAAKENNVTLPPEVYDKLGEDENEDELVAKENEVEVKATLLDLVKTPNMRNMSLNIFFNWFVNSGVYYGLSLNTSNLGGNDYLNFLISGAVEVPAYTMIMLTLNKWGRKKLLCGNMVIGGVALVATAIVPGDMTWLLITLAMIGKLAITASYGVIYIFSAELFPTVVRNAGIGASSTCARVGGILAPYALILADYWMPMPMLIFGGLAFAAGVLALFLPETQGRKLPETILDGENFARVGREQNYHNGIKMVVDAMDNGLGDPKMKNGVNVTSEEKSA